MGLLGLLRDQADVCLGVLIVFEVAANAARLGEDL
jgi:hypothetical protein